jgi:hypothetical protein
MSGVGNVVFELHQLAFQMPDSYRGRFPGDIPVSPGTEVARNAE